MSFSLVYLPWRVRMTLEDIMFSKCVSNSEMTASHTAGSWLGVCCFWYCLHGRDSSISLPWSPPLSSRKDSTAPLSLSRPNETPEPGAMAFKPCQSSHFSTRNGASVAFVTVTQPELYLELHTWHMSLALLGVTGDFLSTWACDSSAPPLRTDFPKSQLPTQVNYPSMGGPSQSLYSFKLLYYAIKILFIFQKVCKRDRGNTTEWGNPQGSEFNFT